MARILLVDDDADLREMLAIRLNRAGHLVTELEGGNAIISGILPAIYDLVITDIYMPNGEGIETLRYLKRNWPDTPVIVMSGGGFEPSAGGYLAAAKALGAAAALEKPFAAAALLDAVSSATAARAA